MRSRKPIAERFWAKVQKGDECWEWQACLNASGYGQINDSDGRALLAHRLSWEIANGPAPASSLVCHRCDNRKCVRPDHLFLGTYADNNHDMQRKGRAFPLPHPTGEGHHQAKLTAEQVEQIRKACAAGEKQRSVACRFGVGQSQVQRIASGQGWKHIGQSA